MANILQDLQNSMDRLANINRNIQANLQQRTQFSASLLGKLRDISGRIRDIVGRITALKADVDRLQAQVNSHTTSIDNGNAQIADLQAQIQRLEGEKQQATQQFTDLQAQVAADRQAIQREIDSKEEDLRRISGERDALRGQVDTLQADLAARGDPQQHAEAIANLTQQHQQQLDAKDQALAAREAELTQQITLRDQQIQQLNTALQQKQVEVDGHIADIGNNQQQARDQINQLNLRIAALEGENDRLKDRIVAATGAIVEASNNLEALMNAEPNQQSQNDIEAVFNEIEQSLQAITNAMQDNGLPTGPPPPAPGRRRPPPLPSNRPPSGSPPPVPRGPRLPGDTPIVLDGANFTLDNLLLQLQAKSQQQPGNPSNKYAVAAQQIKNAADISDVNDILNKANIMTTRNGLIKGGRRTRKLSKKGGKKSKKVQKGGYTYKSNKRRSITSSRPSSRPSSKR
jgi:predicted  nucleic acid-binding Zn-ribbon protein